MQPQIVLSVPEQVTLVIAFVAAARVRVPSVNGWWVLVLSFVGAVAVASTQVSWDTLAALRSVLQSALMIFLYAVGGVSVVQAGAKPILDAIAVRRSLPGSSPAPTAVPEAEATASASGAGADGK